MSLPTTPMFRDAGPRTPLNLRDIERDNLDQQIAELEKTIQALKAKRNQLIPVSSLPLEVLTKIFFLVRSQAQEYEWIIVTHVSHYWRAVALGAHALWTNIIHRTFYRPISVPMTVLQRSGMCQLDVEIDHSDIGPQSFFLLSTILGQLSRIRTLHVRLDNDSDPYSVNSPDLMNIVTLLRNPAPVLEEFHFTGNIFTPCESTPPSGRPECYNNLPWFNRVSPMLRSLVLHYPPSDLTALHYQNLTHLELQGLDDPDEALSRMSFSTLLGLLSGMNALETLTLDYAFSFGPAPPQLAGGHRVSLESLSSSTLTLPARDLIHFLSAVSVPSTSRNTIITSLLENQPEFLSALIGYFRDGMTPISAIECTLKGDVLNLELWALFGGQTEKYLSLHIPQMNISFSGFDALPLSQVRTLYMANESKTRSLPDPQEVFGWCLPLVHLRDLTLASVFTGHFFKFMNTHIALFPALERLVVYGERNGSGQSFTWLVGTLHDFLQRRVGDPLCSQLKLLELVNLRYDSLEAVLRSGGLSLDIFRPLVLAMKVGDRDAW
ncbi:hypothetical protein BDN72DRAFT_844364 [Pluteus cervinus]|uniref:Uncharacterized protein n=1 Tax=Pluteus cervinus TaxID=181527 RepID=A0ACD3AL50_9AGAR|nr:hypothetical protein BDN72DRAFT_844364 [Pluteus cervinus]